MSLAGSQQRTLLQLLAQLRPHWRRDPALPARIQTLLAGHRAFGSRDRRLYRELIYTALRYLPWIERRLESDPAETIRTLAWFAAETPATRLFRAAYATGPRPEGDRSELLPSWCGTHCPELLTPAELDCQLRRAPLWLRLQSDTPGAERVFAEFTARGWAWRPATVLPGALELLHEADVTTTEAWQDGRVEVQDLGSQLLLHTVGIAPGGHWLDACAGAGGKSLQLARLLGPRGRVDAHDIRRSALDELQRRARRAGLSIPIVASPPPAHYDGVLVDAPCTGTGTWRRAPHLKWVTTEERIAAAAAQQFALLRQFSACVRPGGRLVYATCSLSRRENEEVVAAFLAESADFASISPAATFGYELRGGGLTLLPSRHDTDGFFVASFQRRPATAAEVSAP